MKGENFIPKIFDFGFAMVEVRVTKGGHSKDGQFDMIKFRNVDTDLRTERRCFELNSSKEVNNDVEMIKKGKIKGTNFYSNWVRLFLKNDLEFYFKDNSDGSVNKGSYSQQDPYRKNTFYFDISGEIVQISGYDVILDKKEYSL